MINTRHGRVILVQYTFINCSNTIINIFSLQKNIKRLGYTNYVKGSMEAIMCVKMTTALALLPYKIEDFKK